MTITNLGPGVARVTAADVGTWLVQVGGTLVVPSHVEREDISAYCIDPGLRCELVINE